jgi:putative sterol carrier protein
MFSDAPREFTMKSRLLLGMACAGLALQAAAQAPVLMSPQWATQACEAWNKEPELTGALFESGWVKNDAGRGFKVMQLYRRDCGEQPTAEMRVVAKDDKAICTFGGAVQTAKLDSGSDYVMSADTSRWLEMGKGDYGPMRAMMLSRLHFSGPKFEAMGNMGPFSEFLLLVGKVPGDASRCPQ